MATGAPSQTVGTQGSLSRSATSVQPITALPGDGAAKKLDSSSGASGGHLTDVGNDGNNPEGQAFTPTARAVGSGMIAEQSAATSAPMSVDLQASAEAGAEGRTESAVSSEQEATLLDSPSGVSMESDEEPHLASAKVGTSWKTKTTAKWKATQTLPSEAKKEKRPRNQGIWEAAFQKAKKDNLLGIIIIRGEPYAQVRQSQVEKIKKTLMSELHTALKTGLISRFENSGRRNGRFCLSCADQTTFDWLRSITPDINLVGL